MARSSFSASSKNRHTKDKRKRRNSRNKRKNSNNYNYNYNHNYHYRDDGDDDIVMYKRAYYDPITNSIVYPQHFFYDDPIYGYVPIRPNKKNRRVQYIIINHHRPKPMVNSQETQTPKDEIQNNGVQKEEDKSLQTDDVNVGTENNTMTTSGAGKVRPVRVRQKRTPHHRKSKRSKVNKK